MPTTSSRCPKCRSRSLIHDYDDLPDSRARVMVCLCCGKRISIAIFDASPVPERTLAKPVQRGIGSSIERYRRRAWLAANQAAAE